MDWRCNLYHGMSDSPMFTEPSKAIISVGSSVSLSRDTDGNTWHPDLIIQQQLLNMHSIDQKYSTVNYDGVFIKNSALTDYPYPLRNADDFFLPRVRNDFF